MAERIERQPQPKRAPFFRTTIRTSVDDLSVLHLKRDSLVPVILKDTADDGYAEGAVTNTRFGSFPHSTLLGLDWGSQVRASKVDTGTRGRKAQKKIEAAKNDDQSGSLQDDQNKRKREDGDAIEAGLSSPTKKHKSGRGDREGVDGGKGQQHKAAVQAGSGFLHILPPTPESWTYSLDHRTQVVYTPDYSYVLQRLRVRPGSRLIEAGAGSGSFTHAAARAVFSGYPTASDGSSPQDGVGGVYSYEYHAPRVSTLRQELSDHGLDGVVSLTHRDVCNDGFLLPDGTSPQADAVFLDLPAPWVALKHLTRSLTPSPLTSASSVQICTFSPCIEQVQATMSTMRKMGWVDVEMVEVAHRRIDVRRERVGLREEGLRGVNAVAATVEEAIERQREVERKLEVFHESKKTRQQEDGNAKEGTNGERQSDGAEDGREGGNGDGAKHHYKDNVAGTATRQGDGQATITSKQERLARIREEVAGRKLYKEGNLVHRTEPDVKTHTSYLVFAILPREWNKADEDARLAEWPVDDKMMKTTLNGGSKGRKGGEGGSKQQKKGRVSVS